MTARRARMRILLAEDERMVARLVSQVLASLGHDVTAVEAAGNAISLLGGETFDLVLLDLNLADGDGMRVVDAMREGPIPTAPVILMTGEDVLAPGDPRSSFVAGILPKPFEIAELEAAVSRFDRA